MRRWLLVPAALLLAALLAAGVGLALPRAQRVAAARIVAASPEAVWGVLTDYAAYPTWREELEGMERLPDAGGREVWRERHRDGTRVRLLTILSDPPRRLVRVALRDGDAVHREFTLDPAQGGTRVVVIERRDVRNPIARFRARFLADHREGLERFLRALASRFGTPGGVA